ncbi:MAG: S-layer homology domain-containing protein [Clostridia bacterium]|nr:S-layer homology domain-containing protein [Clostridia bacterium]
MLNRVKIVITMLVVSIMVLLCSSVLATPGNVIASINGENLLLGSVAQIYEGTTIKLSSTNATSISYKLGTNDPVTINGSSINISAPTSFTNAGTISLQVYSKASDNTYSELVTYYLKIIKSTTSPIVAVDVNGIIVSTASKVIINEGQEINISATQTSGISQIQYKIGTSSVQTINGASGNITIPTAYTNTGIFSLQVIAYANDGTANDVAIYTFEVVKEAVVVANPVVTVKVNDTTVSTASKVIINEGQVINISATQTSGINQIQYKIGTSAIQTISGASGNVIIPTAYTNTGIFSLQVIAYANDGTANPVVTYTFEVVKEEVVASNPVVTVKVNDTTVSTASKAIINEGQVINISATQTSGINQIQYKIGQETVKALSGASGNITIPITYTNTGVFSLQVIAIANDGTANPVVTYTFEVVKAVTSIPTVVLKVNDTVVNTSSKAIINEGQVINISATQTSGISQIQYKIGTSAIQTISGASGNITIPTAYTNTGIFSLQVIAYANDGTANDVAIYTFEVVKEAVVVANPVVTVKVNDTTVSTASKVIINEGQVINISATQTSGINQIQYKIGTSAIQTISGASGNVIIPTAYTNTGIFSLQVIAYANDGTANPVVTYTFEVVKEEVVASNPVVTVKVNDTTVSTASKAIINEGQVINISATQTSGINQIQYKIGQETVKALSGASGNITIPITYTNTGVFSLQVIAIANDGTANPVVTYTFEVVKAVTSIPTVVLKVNDTVVNTSSKAIINEGQVINISATQTSGINQIQYKIGTSAIQTISGASGNVTIPTAYTNTGIFSLQVIAYANDGTANPVVTYTFEVVDSEKPVVVLKINDVILSKGSKIIIDEGQVINIVPTHSTGISKIEYKIGTSSVQTINGASGNITIPTSYTNTGVFSLQVIAYSNSGIASDLATYSLEVNKDINTSKTEVNASVNGTILNTNSLVKINEGQEIVLSTTNGAKIYYKIGASYINNIVGSSGIITIPTEYTNAGTISLQAYAILNDGTQTATKVYYIQVIKNVNNAPTIEVSINGTPLIVGYKAIINEGQEIVLKTTGTKIQYKIGLGQVKTINASTGSIVIPTEYTNTGAFSLQVIGYSSNGIASSTYSYTMEVKAGLNNITYPFIILKDEKLNTNLEGLNVSLRTVPLTSKTGNMNYILLNEYVQYNIDFINVGATITNKVTVTFEIPTGFSIKVVDSKGGTVSGNKITWTFDGLAKNEKGTIPVTVYYTGTKGNGAIVTPVTKIATTRVIDTSSVWNYIIKDSTSTVVVNHVPFMIGDEGTNTFRPNDGLNRAEMAMILVRILGLNLVTDDTITYKDAKAFEDGRYVWSKAAVMTVTKAGLMTGYDDGTFQPGSKLTKAQVITIVARALELQNKNVIDSPLAIKDQPIKLFNNLTSVYTSYGSNEHWAAKYLAQLIRLNVLPDFANTIDGDLDIIITRAETAKLICTMLTRGPSIDVTKNLELTNTFIDVDLNTSYYQYIVETTANAHNAQYQKNGWEKIVK